MRSLNPFKLLVASCLVILAALAVLVWPTPYRYDHATIDGQNSLIRSNRVTGNSQIFSASGWRSTGVTRNLSSNDLSELTVAARPETRGLYLHLQIFNGSRLELTELTVRVTRIEGFQGSSTDYLEPETRQRVYVQPTAVEPHSQGSETLSLGEDFKMIPQFDLPSEARLRWRAWAGASDDFLFSQWSNPGVFRGTFREYAALTDEQVGEVITSQKSGWKSHDGPWYWELIGAKGTERD